MISQEVVKILGQGLLKCTCLAISLCNNWLHKEDSTKRLLLTYTVYLPYFSGYLGCENQREDKCYQKKQEQGTSEFYIREKAVQWEGKILCWYSVKAGDHSLDIWQRDNRSTHESNWGGDEKGQAQRCYPWNSHFLIVECAFRMMPPVWTKSLRNTQCLQSQLL